jgi:hypothetical protein
MPRAIGKGQMSQMRSKVRSLSSKHRIGDPTKPNVKRERFLALLKSRYGYTNEKAIDDLEKLLKQFHVSNRSLGIRSEQPNIEIPPVE